MIETGIGILLLGLALAAGLGLGQGAIPIPLGIASSAAIAALGLLLVCHGIYRLRLKRGTGDRHWLRTSGLMWLVLALLGVFGLAVPLAAPLLNAVRLAGFPIGYYMAAQGSLVVFVIMLFAFAWRADAIDEQEGAGEE